MTNIKNFASKKFNETRAQVMDEYSQRLVEATLRYQKKYGFELNYKQGHEHLTWNCEGDAFKHVFGSALMAMDKGLMKSHTIGWWHEHEYLKNPKKYSNPKNEKDMDTHNNMIGRRIAEELIKDYAGRWDNLTQQQQEDIIADRVWKHMQAGDVILDPSGRTKLKSSGKATGFAANITDDEAQDIINNYRKNDIYNALSDEEILNLDRKIKENEFFNPKNRVFYENEFNPALAPRGSNDDIGIQEMIRQYWENNHYLPQKEDLDERVRTGELVYVHDYVRADGTKVSGYYRACPKGY